MENVECISARPYPVAPLPRRIGGLDEEIYLHNPSPVSDICDRRGVPDWNRLAPLTLDSDVFVGELVDEELQLCRTYAGLSSEADPYWTPHQWRFAPELQALATRTVERVLVCQEAIVYGRDQGATLLPFHEGIAFAFEHAVAQITWCCDQGERGERVGALVLLDDGTVLHDDIDADGGQHLLVFRSGDREVLYLAGILDPDNRARWVHAEPAASTMTAMGAVITSTTVRRGPVWRPPQMSGTVRTFATTQGVWMLEGGEPSWPNGSAERLDDDGVFSLARRLLFEGSPLD